MRRILEVGEAILKFRERDICIEKKLLQQIPGNGRDASIGRFCPGEIGQAIAVEPSRSHS
jgi:hypothetical protein